MAQVGWRHAELDAVNLIQHLETFGLPTIPGARALSGSIVGYGDSVATYALQWAAYYDRSTLDASAPARFHADTRLGALILSNAQSSFESYKQTLSILPHFLASHGNAADPLGASDPTERRDASPLWYGRNSGPKNSKSVCWRA